MKDNKLFIKKTIEELIPIHKFLGLELLELRKGYVRVRVPFREEGLAGTFEQKGTVMDLN
jgi:acyl-coenzyme A thioesterase PaaI-like protein